MGHWIAWVWADMWPNIFAPSFYTLLGISLSHLSLRKHITRKHEELKRHISDQGK